jgi:hypothetical protein
VDDLLTIDDGVEIIQTGVIERREIVVLPIGGDRVDDLVEI